MTSFDKEMNFSEVLQRFCKLYIFEYFLNIGTIEKHALIKLSVCVTNSKQFIYTEYYQLNTLISKAPIVCCNKMQPKLLPNAHLKNRKIIA